MTRGRPRRAPLPDGARGRTILVVAAAFVVLGLPDGALGVSWPAMRADFGRSVGELSWVVAALTVGYLASTASTGGLSRRWGTARLGGSGAAVMAVALCLLALAPVWALVLVAAATWGLGAGALDAGLNAEVALRADGRTMGMLHAGYGLGAASGPLLAGAIIVTDAGWRPVYVLIAAACLVGTLAARDLRTEPSSASAGPASHAGAVTRRVPDLLGPPTFFLYVCVELGAGHWAFTALTEDGGTSTGTAARWVASYWAAMTAGRLWLGLVGHRLDPRRVLAASAAGAVAASALVAGGIPGGLPALGLSLASIFPTMVLVTPRRVGRERAAATIGWQMAAAGVGGAAGPAAVGGVIAHLGVGAYGPAVLALATLLAAAVAATALSVRAAQP